MEIRKLDKDIYMLVDVEMATDLLTLLHETGEYIAAGAHFEVPPVSMKRLIEFYQKLDKVLT